MKANPWFENDEDIWKNIIWAYKTVEKTVTDDKFTSAGPNYISLYKEQIGFIKVDPAIRFTFQELITGFWGMIRYKASHELKLEFCLEKVKTENVKWNEIIRCFSIDPKNIKCGNRYSFTLRNACFVILMLNDYIHDPEFKKIKNGNLLKRNSRFLQKISLGFTEIMIDAGKSEYEIKTQIKKIPGEKFDKGFLSSLKEKGFKKSKLYTNKQMDKLIDNLLPYNHNLSIMDQITIYKHMWHEFNKFLREWKREGIRVAALMSDLRKLECDQDNPEPSSVLFDQLAKEVAYSMDYDPEIVKIQTKIANTDNDQEIKELDAQLDNVRTQIFLDIHKKYHINPYSVFYCVYKWEIKTSEEIYKIAKKANCNWYKKT